MSKETCNVRYRDWFYVSCTGFLWVTSYFCNPRHSLHLCKKRNEKRERKRERETPIESETDIPKLSPAEKKASHVGRHISFLLFAPRVGLQTQTSNLHNWWPLSISFLQCTGEENHIFAHSVGEIRREIPIASLLLSSFVLGRKKNIGIHEVQETISKKSFLLISLCQNLLQLQQQKTITRAKRFLKKRERNPQARGKNAKADP